MKNLFAGLKRQSTECEGCIHRDDRIAKLRERLRSKALSTYPIIMADQIHLSDKVAFADKDRPWRAVAGTVVGCGWTGAGTFELTLAPGWTWTDNIPPSEEYPKGYYRCNTAHSYSKFELDGDKKFRLLFRLDLS